jgi:hypothetical protein
MRLRDGGSSKRAACRSRVRLVVVLGTVLLAATLHSAVALADGDPASDILPLNDVFYPYFPPVSRTLRNALNEEVATARRAGFPIKIALIASPQDLGAVPILFGRPREYAKFLDLEISPSGGPKQPLIVVMPAGFGAQGLSARAANAATSLTRPPGRNVDDLARAAVLALPTLTAVDGHAIKRISVPSGGTSGDHLSVWIRVLAGLAAISTATVVLRGRRNVARRRRR